MHYSKSTDSNDIWVSSDATLSSSTVSSSSECQDDQSNYTFIYEDKNYAEYKDKYEDLLKIHYRTVKKLNKKKKLIKKLCNFIRQLKSKTKSFEGLIEASEKDSEIKNIARSLTKI